MICNQGVLKSKRKLLIIFVFLISLVNFKRKIKLQVMTNCLLDFYKMFIVIEGKGSLIFFNKKKRLIPAVIYDIIDVTSHI